MISAPVPAKPANDDDNRPWFRWPPQPPRPQYDLWYAVVQHPTQPLALWFRYTLLQCTAGRSEARLWAIVSDETGTGRSVLTSQRFDLAAVSFDPERFGLQLADAGSFCNGRATGRLASDHGEVGWDLGFEPAGRTFAMLADRRLQLRLAPTGYLTPNMGVRASGEFWVGDQRVGLDRAPMTQGHLFGRRMVDHFVWCTCPSFDNAPGCHFEAIAGRRILGSVMMSCQLVLDGEVHAFNTLPDLVGGLVGLGSGASGRFELGRWHFRARHRDIIVEGDVIGDRAPYKLVRYLSPDGSSRYNNHQSRASMVLRVRRVDGTSRELICSERASFDFVASQPAPGCAEHDYRPHFD